MGELTTYARDMQTPTQSWPSLNRHTVSCTAKKWSKLCVFTPRRNLSHGTAIPSSSSLQVRIGSWRASAELVVVNVHCKRPSYVSYEHGHGKSGYGTSHGPAIPATKIGKNTKSKKKATKTDWSDAREAGTDGGDHQGRTNKKAKSKKNASKKTKTAWSDAREAGTDGDDGDQGRSTQHRMSESEYSSYFGRLLHHFSY